MLTVATIKNYLSHAKMAGRKKSGTRTKTLRGADSGAEDTAPVTESKTGGEGSVTSIDRATRDTPGHESVPWGEDAHASSGDGDADCKGDSASRRRGCSAVCVRSEGGHQGHLKVQHSVSREMTAK